MSDAVPEVGVCRRRTAYSASSARADVVRYSMIGFPSSPASPGSTRVAGGPLHNANACNRSFPSLNRSHCHHVLLDQGPRFRRPRSPQRYDRDRARGDHEFVFDGHLRPTLRSGWTGPAHGVPGPLPARPDGERRPDGMFPRAAPRNDGQRPHLRRLHEMHRGMRRRNVHAADRERRHCMSPDGSNRRLCRLVRQRPVRITEACRSLLLRPQWSIELYLRYVRSDQCHRLSRRQSLAGRFVLFGRPRSNM